MKTKLKKNSWDYTAQAKFYSNRPNYAARAIDRICAYVDAKNEKNYVVADIGAGTGNLTIMLADRVGRVIAVEPNQAMRDIGIEKTSGYKNIEWRSGTGESIPIEDGSIDLVTFGSSFNTTDRKKSLKESYRILKSRGYFACMWNNRDLNLSSQKEVEDIIKRHCSGYTHGVRRQQQANVILGSKLFNNIHYFEQPQKVIMGVERYLDGWRSVTNKFWDLNTAEGRKLFEDILGSVRERFKKDSMLELIYVTKVWIAEKQKELESVTDKVSLG